MKCEEVRERLLETMRGRGHEAEVTLHLKGCAACSRALQEYKKLFDLLEAESEPSFDAVRSLHYLVSIRERIEATFRDRVLGFPRPGFAMTLVSVAVIALLLFNITKFSGRFPYVTSYSPSSGTEYLQRPASTYLEPEEELAYLLSDISLWGGEPLSGLLSQNETKDLIQAGELLYRELSLELLLEDLTVAEIEVLRQRIQNSISALPTETEGVREC